MRSARRDAYGHAATEKGEVMEINTVGIVGAGQMGNGIAHVFALAGFDVLMTDITQEALDKALALIARNMDRQVTRGKITADASARR